VQKRVPNPVVKTSIAALVGRSMEADKARVGQLADLLERMMTLDPEKRLDADGALRHPFVREYLPRKKDAQGKLI
jgi:serine/threonine protein kinase